VSATRPPTRPAAGPLARQQRYRRRQTTTDDRHQRAKQYWPIRRASNNKVRNADNAAAFRTWPNNKCNLEWMQPALFVILQNCKSRGINAINLHATKDYFCWYLYVYYILSSLQLLLGVCEKELERIDMNINVKKSSCMRIGPRFNVHCSCITTCNGR